VSESTIERPAQSPTPQSPPRPVGSIAELRRICQDPVRQYNDLSGALYGWRVSIYVTRFLLKRGCTASFASLAMFICGFVGSLLLLGPSWWRIGGLVLLVGAFVLDCVDGEMARFAKIDSYRWAAFDNLHHLTAKSLAFFCLGLGLHLERGEPFAIAAGGLLSIFWLALLVIRDLPTAIFAKKIVMNDGREQNPAYLRLLENMRRPDVVSQATKEREDARMFCGEFRLRPWVIRAFFVNFDIVVPLFLAGALVDHWVSPFTAFDRAWTVTTLMIYAYAVIIPLHTIDVLVTAMWRGRLRAELYDLAARVERFREKR
jgi:phosphatidylglycerophosphate synthase